MFSRVVSSPFRFTQIYTFFRAIANDSKGVTKTPVPINSTSQDKESKLSQLKHKLKEAARKEEEVKNNTPPEAREKTTTITSEEMQKFFRETEESRRNSFY